MRPPSETHYDCGQGGRRIVGRLDPQVRKSSKPQKPRGTEAAAMQVPRSALGVTKPKLASPMLISKAFPVPHDGA